MESGNVSAILTKTQRFVLGSFILLLVDVIWVFSSELTKYIYHTETFQKPFFCTYVKTSMFALYLLGFFFWPPWRNYCNKTQHFLVLESDQEDDNFYEEGTSLSEPIYVPVKTNDRGALDRSSGTESDDSSIRSVKFNKLAEVRHMSESEATEAFLARLSYQASLRAGEYAKRAAVKLPVMKVAKLSMLFCLMWFAANYTFQLALSMEEAGMVTVLSATSCLFTLFLSAMVPSTAADKFTISKLVAVCLGLGGIVLICISANISLKSNASTGIILSILSSLFYSIYIVYLRKNVDHEDKMDIPLFFGFVGLFNIVLLWPMFFIIDMIKVEEFEWPSKRQLTFLILNGLIGTVVSEALWLWGCFLTSSLVATMAISLTIPMTMVADVFFKRISYPCLFYLGTIPMLMAFIVVTLLSHKENWDPVLEFIRGAYLSLCRRNRIRFRFPEKPSEQTEALIGIDCNEHEA